MSKFIDFTGRRFSALVALRRTGQRKPSRWECRCDCGNVTVVLSGHLSSGHTKSCGCLRRTWKINPDAAIRRHFCSYSINARRRNIPFYITFEQFASVVALNCFWCGQAPSMVCTSTSITRTYGGVDRKDSRLGYTPDNCLPCCTMCNSAKSDYAVEKFLSWAHQLVTYQQAVK